MSLGVQASTAMRTDIGVGPRVMVDLPGVDEGLRFIGSFEIYFPDASEFQDYIDSISEEPTLVTASVDYWEANAGLAYSFGLVPGVRPYFGGGFSVGSVDISDSTAGLADSSLRRGAPNALAGFELVVAGTRPFVEFRYRFGGNPGQSVVNYLGNQWIVTAGITF